MKRATLPQTLFVRMNNRLVGRLSKKTSGALTFAYAEERLSDPLSVPISLSMPLREGEYAGEAVRAYFENLLPDNPDIRKRAAERVGAEGSDAYHLLAAIGRDCVGALQFSAESDVSAPVSVPKGRVIKEEEIEKLLSALNFAPLGLDGDTDFRISVAGAQEKTALLRQGEDWLIPQGDTPTTHILKPAIGRIHFADGTLDFADSPENEYYCLRLFGAFGLPVAQAEICRFGAVKALAVERFDRLKAPDGRIFRLPQEDCCQALSVPPSRKYQNQGGPGVKDILALLSASDNPEADQAAFLKSQFLFYLIGATDGHAKNFSLLLKPGGGFRLAPFYDILSAQPAVDKGEIRRNKFKLAMSVGESGKYRIETIALRHLIETAREAGFTQSAARALFEEITDHVDTAFETIASELPADFPAYLHESLKSAAFKRRDQSR